MSKVAICLLVVAAVAIALSVSGGRTSVGLVTAEESPRKGEMQKWEYKVVEYGYGYKDMKAREKAFTE
jgi:hypothetical protein